MSDELPIAKSTLSQHLKELKDTGLIQGEIESPRKKYCINKENWKEAQQLFKQFHWVRNRVFSDIHYKLTKE